MEISFPSLNECRNSNVSLGQTIQEPKTVFLMNYINLPMPCFNQILPYM